MKRAQTSLRAHELILRALVETIIRKEPDAAVALGALFEDVNQALDFADDQTDLPHLRNETAAIRKRVEAFFTQVRLKL